MHDNDTARAGFTRVWPLWRLCLGAAFIACVAWATVIDHPVKWFAIAAIYLLVLFVRDLCRTFRPGRPRG